MLHDLITLQRSMRERRSVIQDDYVVFLQETKEINGMMEDILVNFHQAIENPNSKKWIEAMNE